MNEKTTLDPSNSLVIAFNILTSLSIVILCFFYSLHIFFGFDLDGSKTFTLIRDLSSVTYLIEIILKVNVAYYEKGLY